MTTTHTFDREAVMAFVDGELAGVEAEAVRAHLDICAECQAMAGEFRQVSARLATWTVESVPARLTLPPSAERPRSFGALFAGVFALPRWVLVAAPALVVVLAVSFVQSMPALPDAQEERARSIAHESMISAATVPIPLASPVESGLASAGRAFGQAQRGDQAPPSPALPAVPMVVRIATLQFSTDAFDTMRATVERLSASHDGRIESLSVGGDANRRSLSATLRVPSARLDALLAALRPLGRVRNEAINTQDVTSEYQDLSIRIANSKREETRLVELLARRTDKLADVLAVEQELARVRTDVERMEASLRATKNQVDRSTVKLLIEENYRAEVALGPLPLGARLRNAFVDGVGTAASGVVSIVLALVQIAPTLLLWALLLFWPVKWAVGRLRRAEVRTSKFELRS